jgi:DNA-binding response OmpR family regulator
MKILWIEDDLVSIEFLVDYLKGKNVHVTTERDFEAAWDMVKIELEFDAYIIDLWLPQDGNPSPEKNGKRIIDKLKELNITKPIIICTNHSEITARKYGYTNELYIRKDKLIPKEFYRVIIEYIKNFK